MGRRGMAPELVRKKTGEASERGVRLDVSEWRLHEANAGMHGCRGALALGCTAPGRVPDRSQGPGRRIPTGSKRHWTEEKGNQPPHCEGKKLAAPCLPPHGGGRCGIDSSSFIELESRNQFHSDYK